VGAAPAAPAPARAVEGVRAAAADVVGHAQCGLQGECEWGVRVRVGGQDEHEQCGLELLAGGDDARGGPREDAVEAAHAGWQRRGCGWVAGKEFVVGVVWGAASAKLLQEVDEHIDEHGAPRAVQGRAPHAVVDGVDAQHSHAGYAAGRRCESVSVDDDASLWYQEALDVGQGEKPAAAATGRAQEDPIDIALRGCDEHRRQRGRLDDGQIRLPARAHVLVDVLRALDARVPCARFSSRRAAHAARCAPAAAPPRAREHRWRSPRGARAVRADVRHAARVAGVAALAEHAAEHAVVACV
jgi:hypothetical protein